MRFIWPDSARADLRAIDRELAIRILHSLTEYGESGKGDLKALAGQWQGYFRLRIGDYRIILAIAPEEITIVRVRHRSEAYR
ncbi:MAG TPA: type II toxin-antitoxin system RelE/ParE family toxin [Bryobacteraceae bacterium]|nr:type II toxin-antitoxin system RelE/ParE family toxin [Bryobacteraceae bacterium]